MLSENAAQTAYTLLAMPNIDKHPAGSFSWVELATTDQNAAKNFYTSLFGWSINEFPMGPGAVYTIFRLQDRDAAAAYTLQPELKGVPPHWNLYITVDNADQAAAKAAELGGKILQPAFDVMDAGRMAVVQDPTGATFMVWQAKKSTGIGITGVDGTFCWADLSTTDPDRAATSTSKTARISSEAFPRQNTKSRAFRRTGCPISMCPMWKAPPPKPRS